MVEDAPLEQPGADDGTKYGKYIIREPYTKFYQTESFTVTPEKLGCNVIITSQGFYEPIENVGKEPHKHDFHQILCFIGGDPTNIRDFGAEVEMYLGEELEKHVITSNAAISVPPGLYHCPIHFRRVDKPVVFLEIMLVDEYRSEPLKKD
ncbi:MAG: hypothetical protein N3B14_00840 [Thermoleophilia bacterium]|nr:hypothetical protein [Thermoleophilia bacterium]